MRLQERYHKQQLEILKLKQELRQLKKIVSGPGGSNFASDIDASNFAAPNIIRMPPVPPPPSYRQPLPTGYPLPPMDLGVHHHGPHPPQANQEASGGASPPQAVGEYEVSARDTHPALADLTVAQIDELLRKLSQGTTPPV